ncbi:hypothetical protein AQJ46_49820 [Streptomyces canus]|uniref:Uncharacterized protein n=1 Tax=Streptomyces canus TaxID=58343 RepID=A0A101RK35_9ACTN|nr:MULTISPECIES: hypothetical protein [Streptomyces]KUN54944.1 hypothetical protein AQJ46_49820 [Streptomyces canus]MDI5906455.1 hypothetical protein [Streptomyces sp. 12257]
MHQTRTHTHLPDVRFARQGEVPAISTFDELHELGHFGPVCLSLIYKLIREEVRRLPVLSPPGGWQEADLEDLLGDFLADRIEPVTANLLALARNDDSVGKLLRTSIRYWLIDRSRKTAVVSVGRSLEKVLADSDAFEVVPLGTEGAGRWRLAGTTVQPWSGPVTPLVEAAYAVPNVKIPKWSSETRRAPVADRASTEAVTIAVLTAASGSMEVAQLVEVFTARFPVVLDPVVVSLPADAGSEITVNAQSSPEEIVFARIDDAETTSLAEEVVSMLSPQERRIVPYLDAPGEIQTLLGCGRSQAYHHAAHLREKLRQLVGDGDDVLSVGAEVIRLCSGVAETR